MKTQWTSGVLAGMIILVGALSVPAVADEGSSVAAPFAVEEDLFGAEQVVGEEDLEGLRGGEIISSFNTEITTTAKNEVNASIGTMTIDVGGNVRGGNVTFRDNALGRFSGIFTPAINTAPGANVTATTALSVMLVP